jgi:hypothetical protein
MSSKFSLSNSCHEVITAHLRVRMFNSNRAPIKITQTQFTKLTRYWLIITQVRTKLIRRLLNLRRHLNGIWWQVELNLTLNPTVCLVGESSQLTKQIILKNMIHHITLFIWTTSIDTLQYKYSFTTNSFIEQSKRFFNLLPLHIRNLNETV